ncbi:MAG: hypothetical protein H6524_03490 [Actinobacteria bacterium]|jgi:hypothetical protein|nr:hypothetical protein [Micrococcales bacterium]MCB0905081.1 hypothetical protein [Actinomycetota bacterium]MCO5299441.1 hypothetical protein [Candidatus Nanopelagicales bacterium]MCB9427853.1 hypothetical protein [Actinomycetota bacterium]HPJ19546.1 hypothetical protein [Actinomycetota bacterium]
MRKFLIAMLVIPALVASGAPANAATPSIRSTKQYQELKAYVSQLNAKKNQQQTPAEISKYRSELSKKRAKASMKVRANYQAQLGQAKDRRANRKAKVVDLKQKRNRQVAQLKSAQQARLNAIAADRRAAIARINTSYSGKEQRLNKQLAKARKKLIKATNPVVRQNLREQIAAIQDQLATLDQEKRDDLRVANNKYDDQADSARENYSQKIEQTTESFNARIQNLQTRLRELYQQSKQNAQQRRANEFGIVKTKYDEGVAYIDAMPVED